MVEKNHQYGKIKIEGTIKLLTGMHIGASSAFAAIGATDSPIIKDPLTSKPLIPGSSLKGKMRSLLAKVYNQTIAKNPNEDSVRIRRLFGDSDDLKVGRLIFRDTILSNEDELFDKGVRTLTEVKFENTIDRFTAMANPRQIERAIAGSEFDFNLIYDASQSEEAEEDFETIITGLKLLELDYLGGNGSRGYGRIEFVNLKAEQVVGELDEGLINTLNDQLKQL